MISRRNLCFAGTGVLCAAIAAIAAIGALHLAADPPDPRTLQVAWGTDAEFGVQALTIDVSSDVAMDRRVTVAAVRSADGSLVYATENVTAATEPWPGEPAAPGIEGQSVIELPSVSSGTQLTVTARFFDAAGTEVAMKSTTWTKP